MDNSVVVLLINDSAMAVKARYEEAGKEGVFKTLDTSIEVGDYAVVESGTRWNKTVVKVTEVDIDVNFDTATDVKWVVQKIDKEGFDTVLEQEKVAISTVQSAERRRKRDELKKTLFKDHEKAIRALPIAKMKD